MNDFRTAITQQEDEFVPLWKGMELLGVKKSAFFYYVTAKKIETRPGEGPKDNRYSLRDILRVKADRKARRSSEPTFTLDWLYPRDLPAVLDLDYEVFDRRMIASIDVYESWIMRNNHIAMCAYDKKDRRKMLAYISMLPLPESTIMQVLKGERDEMDIRAEEIETYERPGEYTLLANSAVTHPDRPDLLYQVLNAITQHWIEQYPVRRISRVYAQSASAKGDILIQKFYFAPLYLLSENQARPVKDAYVLDLSRPGATRVIRHFQQELESKIHEQGLPEIPISPLPPFEAIRITEAPATREGVKSSISRELSNHPTTIHKASISRSQPQREAFSAERPENTITLRELAEELGINRTTLVGHVRNERNHLEHIAIPKPNRPGEYDRYFTPEQVQAAKVWHQAHSKK